MITLSNIVNYITNSLPLKEGLGVGLLALTLAGCQKDDEQGGGNTPQSISFDTELSNDEALTRTAYPLYYYQQSIKFIGTKTVNSTASLVFPNYYMQYLTDSKSWQYISGKQSNVDGQIEKFWDNNATEYRFIAGAPFDKTDINDNTDLTSLTLNGLIGGQASTGTITTSYLFSEPKQVLPASFGSSVMLTFHLALCRIKVQFYYETAQAADINLTGITFGPSSGGTYAKEADMTITYDWTKIATPAKAYTHTVTPTKTVSTVLGYSNLTIAQPGTAKKEANEIYYMIPLSASATASAWTLTIGSLTDHNTAEVPASYMKWEPGHQYVYIFKLSSSKTDSRIKFVTCVKSAITGWQDASETEKDLYNW